MMDSIVVLSDGISFATGEMVANATFYDDQPFGEGYKVNKKREGVHIVQEDFPTLLRHLADIMEQEGVKTIEELSPVLAQQYAKALAEAERDG